MNEINLICKLIETGKVAEARKLIRDKLSSNPKLYNYYMGLCCFTDLDYKSAKSYFKSAEALGLKNSILYYNIGNTMLELGDLESAKSYYYKSIDRNAALHKSYINLAYVLEKEGLYKDAFRIIKTCQSYSATSEVAEYEKALFKRLLSS